MSNVEFEGTEGAVQAIKTGDVKQMINYFDIPAFFHLGFGKKLKFAGGVNISHVKQGVPM